MLGPNTHIHIPNIQVLTGLELVNVMINSVLTPFFSCNNLCCVRPARYGVNVDVTGIIMAIISGQLPNRTIPHRVGIGPDEWFWLVVVLVGSCPSGE